MALQGGSKKASCWHSTTAYFFWATLYMSTLYKINTKIMIRCHRLSSVILWHETNILQLTEIWFCSWRLTINRQHELHSIPVLILYSVHALCHLKHNIYQWQWYLIDTAKEDGKGNDFEEMNFTHSPDNTTDSVQKKVQLAPYVESQQEWALLQCYIHNRHSSFIHRSQSHSQQE